MKTSIRIVILILGLQLAFAHSSSAQKLIRIDENLKFNSQQMRVKRKGISSVGRYEFGSWKVDGFFQTDDHTFFRGIWMRN